MKFGKALQDTCELFPTMPFVRYKLLKQILKCILLEADYDESTQLKEDNHEAKTDVSEGDFVKTLHKEVHTLNEYFISKEEELVIRMQDLESAAQELDAEVKANLLPKLVKFHRDITLLHHWEVINYTAFSKILKKHDKLINGASFREAFLESLFRQPFYSKDLLERLSEQSEKLINKLVSKKGLDNEEQSTVMDKSKATDHEQKELSKLHYAIRTWRELGDNAHTPSTVLPWSKPLPDSMKAWFDAQETHILRSSSPLERDSENPKTERISEDLEDHETKRSRSDDESPLEKTTNEASVDRRENKMARLDA